MWRKQDEKKQLTYNFIHSPDPCPDLSSYPYDHGILLHGCGHDRAERSALAHELPRSFFGGRSSGDDNKHDPFITCCCGTFIYPGNPWSHRRILRQQAKKKRIHSYEPDPGGKRGCRYRLFNLRSFDRILRNGKGYVYPAGAVPYNTLRTLLLSFGAAQDAADGSDDI